VKNAKKNSETQTKQHGIQHLRASATTDLAAPASALVNQSAPPSAGLIDFKQLYELISVVSVRTLRSWVTTGKLPSIKLPGSRRRLFFWDDVQRALRRHQTGGQLT
jgi:hypothetical protein